MVSGGFLVLWGFFQQFRGSFVVASSLPCAGVFTVKSARRSAAVHGSRGSRVTRQMSQWLLMDVSGEQRKLWLQQLGENSSDITPKSQPRAERGLDLLRAEPGAVTKIRSQAYNKIITCSNPGSFPCYEHIGRVTAAADF